MPAAFERLVQKLKDKPDVDNPYALAHYIQNQKNSKILPPMELDSEDGEYATYFLLKGDAVNGREWGVTEESIPKNIETFRGQPACITSNTWIKNSVYGPIWDHPSILHWPALGIAKAGTFDPNDEKLIEYWQNKFRVGVIYDVYKKDDIWRADIKRDAKFKRLPWPQFCSPSIFKLDDSEPDGKITKWVGKHLALLQEKPAYGDIALFRGSCTGKFHSCNARLKEASHGTLCEIGKLRKELFLFSAKTRMAALVSPTNKATNAQVILGQKKKQQKPLQEKIQSPLERLESKVRVAAEFKEEDHPRDEEGKFTCKECGQGYKSKKELSKHIGSHKQKKSHIKQVATKEEIDHTVNVLGYDVEIPVDRDEWEVVDDFLKLNNLYDDVGKINPEQRHELADRIETAMVKHVGRTDNPQGSVYLTTDGEWVGGEAVYGYDEDHRPQISKGLTYAGVNLKENGEWSSSDTMIKALSMTGMIRVGARDTLNLDIYHPLTSAQRRAIQDYIIEKGLSRDDVIIDLNNKIKDVGEDRILRLVMPTDYNASLQNILKLINSKTRQASQFREEDHPRDEEGKFTCKECGMEVSNKDRQSHNESHRAEPRKTQDGFEILRGQKIKITKAAKEVYDEEVISSLAKTWNDVPLEHRKIVKKLVITDQFNDWGGVFDTPHGIPTITLFGIDSPDPESELNNILEHELGHAVEYRMMTDPKTRNEMIKLLEYAETVPPLNEHIENAVDVYEPSKINKETFAEFFAMRQHYNRHGNFDEYRWGNINEDTYKKLEERFNQIELINSNAKQKSASAESIRLKLANLQSSGIKSRDGKLSFTFHESRQKNADAIGSQIPETDLERELGFDEPSSFVGLVVYTPDTQTLEVSLNGKNYGFCNVPIRTFEAFYGAPSKGQFFNRHIKKQFDCY